jgi:hypothetical protein
MGWWRAHFYFDGVVASSFYFDPTDKTQSSFSLNPLFQIRSFKSAPLNPLL